MTAQTAKAAHTPGPWRWEKSYQLTTWDEGDDTAEPGFATRTHWALCRPDVPNVVNDHRLVVIDSWTEDLPGASPDARLIAAAPTLLEALRALHAIVMERTLATPYVGGLRTGVIDVMAFARADQVLSDARAAIRLATEGEQ